MRCFAATIRHPGEPSTRFGPFRVALDPDRQRLTDCTLVNQLSCLGNGWVKQEVLEQLERPLGIPGGLDKAVRFLKETQIGF